jgi:hypothetical protein
MRYPFRSFLTVRAAIGSTYRASTATVRRAFRDVTQKEKAGVAAGFQELGDAL